MGRLDTLLQKISPADFVTKVAGPSGPFLLVYGDAPLLCVSLGDDGSRGDLEAGLASSTDAEGGMQNIGFHTAMVNSQVGAIPSGGFTAVQLRRRLLSDRHFVLPLIKRGKAGLSMERIVVGRARNQDVVLRHQSVSKFHAWFEHDPEGRLLVADAGSTNGTHLDGTRLTPRERVEIEYGAPITFGSVNVFVCDPTVVWEAFHD